jgi:hypothetical protein
MGVSDAGATGEFQFWISGCVIQGVTLHVRGCSSEYGAEIENLNAEYDGWLALGIRGWKFWTGFRT